MISQLIGQCFLHAMICSSCQTDQFNRRWDRLREATRLVMGYIIELIEQCSGILSSIIVLSIYSFIIFIHNY